MSRARLYIDCKSNIETGSNDPDEYRENKRLKNIKKRKPREITSRY